MFKTLRLLSFVKSLFLQIALLLNCRNNIYIPQFLRRNWHSMGSLVVSTLECDAISFDIFSPVLRLDFKYIFFSFDLFFCF